MFFVLLFSYCCCHNFEGWFSSRKTLRKIKLDKKFPSVETSLSNCNKKAHFYIIHYVLQQFVVSLSPCILVSCTKLYSSRCGFHCVCMCFEVFDFAGIIYVKNFNIAFLDIDECASNNDCAREQACRNYPGTYECFCTSPGEFLVNGTCQSKLCEIFAAFSSVIFSFGGYKRMVRSKTLHRAPMLATFTVNRHIYMLI